MKNIILFASGSGSNVQNITEHFTNHPSIKVAAVFCNNPNAPVIERMKPFNIPVVVFNKTTFNHADEFMPMLQKFKPDLIVLAGFLWLIPSYLIQAFPNKIINIHPALLPKFGGKGMYGNHVHQAVLADKETEHGITIHFVNEHYDDGAPIFQAKFEVLPHFTLTDLQQQISALEMAYFPEAIKRVLGE